MNIPPPDFPNQGIKEALKELERIHEEYISDMRAKGWNVTEIHDEIILTPPEKETTKCP